jgi:hypothetical protein
MATTFLEKTVEIQEPRPGHDLLRRRIILKKGYLPWEKTARKKNEL